MCDHPIPPFSPHKGLVVCQDPDSPPFLDADLLIPSMLLETLVGAVMLAAPDTTPDSTLTQRLLARRNDTARVERVYSDARTKPSVDNFFESTAEEKVREDSMTQEEYNQRIGLDTLKNRLPDFIDDHRQALTTAQDKHGVDARYIAAIHGVESSYGDNTGYMRVKDALKSIHNTVPRKRDFALRHADCLVDLVKQHDVDVDSLEGSYAGAFAPAQFLPCSAESFYNDGVQDIDSSIHSVADYLRNNQLEYPETGEPARGDPRHNLEPVTMQTNGVALWAYNRSEAYRKAVTELAESVPPIQPRQLRTYDANVQPPYKPDRTRRTPPKANRVRLPWQPIQAF